MKKERLDKLVLTKGFVDSREKAQALIIAGKVLVDDFPVTKCGTKVSEDSAIRIKGELNRFVSRGGDKLEGAFSEFKLSADKRVCLDVGSSTGGFTDYLLQNGASLVYAVDVGTNQLSHKLRIDKRVRVYEKTHANSLSSIKFDPVPDLVVADVSFISLTKIIPHICDAINSTFEMVLLIKPQFELEAVYIGEGGLVKSEIHTNKAIEKIRKCLNEHNIEEKGLCPSRLKGKKSENQEYFIWGCCNKSSLKKSDLHGSPHNL